MTSPDNSLHAGGGHPHEPGDPEELHDLLANAPCALAYTGVDGSMQWSNNAFRLLTGGSGPGASFLNFLTRAGAIFYETQLLPVILLRGAVKEVALDLVGPGATRVPVFLSANLRRAPDGATLGIRLALFEATERRSYERDLLEARKSAEQLADVVRRALDAIVTLSPEGRVQGWNSGAEQTFGYTADEALGRLFTELLLPPAIHEQFAAAVRKLHTGADVSTEITGLHRDGRELDLSMRLTPHLEPPGVLVAFSAILRDVTSRRVAERALIQNEKLASVGRLASSIAHEINNPLEAVTNLLYLLHSSVSTPEAEGYLRMAEEELARVSHIVTHTLRFHKQSTARAEASPHDVLNSVLTLYKARLRSASVRVDVRCTETKLFCYEGELRQVLMNLMSNAYDAVRPGGGGHIYLRSREATCFTTGRPGVNITIADNGPGIAPSIRDRLFEPFVTTKGITGTGLGLWISRDLVQKNGGELNVRTWTTPGRSGTVLQLWFPHVPADAADDTVAARTQA